MGVGTPTTPLLAVAWATVESPRPLGLSAMSLVVSLMIPVAKVSSGSSSSGMSSTCTPSLMSMTGGLEFDASCDVLELLGGLGGRGGRVVGLPFFFLLFDSFPACFAAAAARIALSRISASSPGVVFCPAYCTASCTVRKYLGNSALGNRMRTLKSCMHSIRRQCVTAQL